MKSLKTSRPRPLSHKTLHTTNVIPKLDPNHSTLSARNFTSATVSAFEAGFCARGSLARRIALPIHDAAGYLIGYAGRVADSGLDDSAAWILPKEFKHGSTLFNLHRAKREISEKPVVVVKDILAAMTLWQCGYRKTVALMSAQFTPEQEALLMRWTQTHTGIALLFNEDDEGRRLREDVARRLTRIAYVHVVTFDEEGFDVEYISEDQIFELNLS